MGIAATAAAVIWLLVLVVPWRPWRIRQTLDAGAAGALEGEITVVVPARDEAGTIRRTVESARMQGREIDVIVVDDASSDGTAAIVQMLGPRVQLIRAPARPAGWTGKLWALECGRREVRTPQMLLLDADIELEPGIVSAAVQKMRDERLALVSLMAELNMTHAWEKFLLPPFVYFFRLIYPFGLVASDSSRVAAAAGGFVLIETAVLDELGGFAPQRDALIDDVTLARRVKQSGNRIWLGLSRDVHSRRRYPTLRSIWQMVARTAYVQLGHSMTWLVAAVALMFLVFVVPLSAVIVGPGAAKIAGLAALIAMAVSYLPLLRYYNRSPFWSLMLPFAAVLYMAMTLGSALAWYGGTGSQWKGRQYGMAARRHRT